MIFDKLHRPLRDLRISVTDRCNFRCTYCMPADLFGHDYIFLDRKEILNFEEIYRVAKIFVGLGVTKIRLTGGEPLLRADLEVLIKMLVRIDGVKDLALTTNGYLLAQKAIALKEAGLKRITISLDTLRPERLKSMAGRHLELSKVLNGIKAANACGFKPIKINTVIQKGINDDEILDLVKFAKSNGLIVRFIEYMDVGTLNGWNLRQVIPAGEIVDMISAEMPVEPMAKHSRSEVANRYRFLDSDGEFNVIASVTQPFCGECTRIRISAAGKVYSCLFSSNGVDIKSILRSGSPDEELEEVLGSIWQRRVDRYSEERSSHTHMHTDKKIEMYQIGG